MRRSMTGRAERRTQLRTLVLVRLLLGVFAGLLAVMSAGGSANAQEDEPEPEPPAGIGEEDVDEASIGGTLRTRDEAGEFVFVEGVTMIVRDQEGNEVGNTVTDEEGNWRVSLPGGGVFDVELVEETLPDGVRCATRGATR